MCWAVWRVALLYLYSNLDRVTLNTSARAIQPPKGHGGQPAVWALGRAPFAVVCYGCGPGLPRRRSWVRVSTDPELRCPATGVKELVMSSDATVAWLLVDAAEPCLVGDERTMIFVELGCGENHLAIERILRVVVESRFPLDATVLTTLTDWLDQYIGSPEERRLRALVAAVRPS